MTIQRMSPDHPDVTRLLVLLGAHNAEQYGHTDLDHTPPESWLCALVAYSDDTAIALLGVCPADDTTVQLVRLFVHPDARGRGLTRRLALEGFEIARQAGYTVATWDTGADIPTVMNTSSQLGAERVAPFGAHESDPRVRCYSVPLGLAAESGVAIAPDCRPRCLQ